MNDDLKAQDPVASNAAADSAASEQEEGATENETASDQEPVSEVADEMDLQAALQDAQAKADEYLDGWQRARAEFANYRKRVERESQETFQKGALDILGKLLPISDDLARALENVPEDLAGHNWVSGIELIHQKLDALLQSENVEVLYPVGEPFDPAYHQAVGADERDDVESGHVTTVLQKGYVCGDKVLRPAIVRVAS